MCDEAVTIADVRGDTYDADNLLKKFLLFQITDDMLCAGGEGGKDSCQVRCILHKQYFYDNQGDSGGPLTVDVDGQHVLVGDVSFGDGCGQVGNFCQNPT